MDTLIFNANFLHDRIRQVQFKNTLEKIQDGKWGPSRICIKWTLDINTAIDI